MKVISIEDYKSKKYKKEKAETKEQLWKSLRFKEYLETVKNNKNTFK